MGHTNLQRALLRRQHGVVARRQLLELGLNADAINHRLERGRLHPVVRGVYAVGRPEVSRFGMWMAAVLACGPCAVISHGSAAALWAIGSYIGDITVSIPAERCVATPASESTAAPTSTPPPTTGSRSPR